MTQDLYTKDRATIKKDLDLTLNTTASLAYIQGQLDKCVDTKLNQGTFKIKDATNISDTKLTISYTNPTALEKINGVDAEDTFTINLDKNFMFTNSNLQWQKATGTVDMTRSSALYSIGEKQKDKITYYGETTGGTETPEIKIVNNIYQYQGTAKKSLFPTYGSVIDQLKGTTDMVQKQVKTEYRTPKTTSIEKQFAEHANITYEK